MCALQRGGAICAIASGELDLVAVEMESNVAHTGEGSDIFLGRPLVSTWPTAPKVNLLGVKLGSGRGSADTRIWVSSGIWATDWLSCPVSSTDKCMFLTEAFQLAPDSSVCMASYIADGQVAGSARVYGSKCRCADGTGVVALATAEQQAVAPYGPSKLYQLLLLPLYACEPMLRTETKVRFTQDSILLTVEKSTEELETSMLNVTVPTSALERNGEMAYSWKVVPIHPLPGIYGVPFCAGVTLTNTTRPSVNESRCEVWANGSMAIYDKGSVDGSIKQGWPLRVLESSGTGVPSAATGVLQIPFVISSAGLRETSQAAYNQSVSVRVQLDSVFEQNLTGE